MKTKIIISIIFVTMFLTSCNWIRHNSTPVTKEVTPDYIYRFEYNGHKYIIFKYNGTRNPHNVSGVVHDPDCKCNRN